MIQNSSETDIGVYSWAMWFISNRKTVLYCYKKLMPLHVDAFVQPIRKPGFSKARVVHISQL